MEVRVRVRKGRRRYGKRREKKKGRGEMVVGDRDLDEVECVECVGRE